MNQPQINTDEHRWNQISEAIIGCSYAVSNELGCGFLEKVYENALAYELRQAGYEVLQQHGIRVSYRGVVVGEYLADLIVEQTVIVELKSARAFEDAHTAQCLNYLKATGYPMGLLLNFGQPKVGIKRLLNKHYQR